MKHFIVVLVMIAIVSAAPQYGGQQGWGWGSFASQGGPFGQQGYGFGGHQGYGFGGPQGYNFGGQQGFGGQESFGSERIVIDVINN